jgi:anti-sigma factor RsiW
MTNPSFRDVELLSAFIDGTLNPSDSARLESRLRSDPELRAVMDDLRAARAVLRKLPHRKAPRNFTLTPKMAGIKPPVPRSYPVLRFASALATLLLVFTFAVNLISTPLTFSAAAPQIPYGAGGGGGDGEAADEAPAAEAAPELQPLPTPESADATRIAGTATPELMSKVGEDQSDQDSTRPIPFNWQVGLLIAALALGFTAWIVRASNDQKWRTRT